MNINILKSPCNQGSKESRNSGRNVEVGYFQPGVNLSINPLTSEIGGGQKNRSKRHCELRGTKQEAIHCYNSGLLRSYASRNDGQSMSNDGWRRVSKVLTGKTIKF